MIDGSYLRIARPERTELRNIGKTYTRVGVGTYEKIFLLVDYYLGSNTYSYIINKRICLFYFFKEPTLNKNENKT